MAAVYAGKAMYHILLVVVFANAKPCRARRLRLLFAERQIKVHENLEHIFLVPFSGFNLSGNSLESIGLAE